MREGIAIKSTFLTRDSNLIIRLSGEIDHHTSKELRDKIDREIFHGEIRRVIFDFNRVSFMDSSGIGLIMGRYRLMEAVGGKVCLFGVSKNLSKLIELSGIKKIVSICNSETEALS